LRTTPGQGQIIICTKHLPKIFSMMNGKTVARILQRHTGPLGITGVSGHSIRRSMARALHAA